MKWFGYKLQHFLNDTFQSYYDLFQVEKDHSMIETCCVKNVVIYIQTTFSMFLIYHLMKDLQNNIIIAYTKVRLANKIISVKCSESG